VYIVELKIPFNSN